VTQVNDASMIVGRRAVAFAWKRWWAAELAVGARTSRRGRPMLTPVPGTRDGRPANFHRKGERSMSIVTILIIVVVVLLLVGFLGRGRF